MRKIALSYRRDDTAAMTGRIFDDLSRHFGAENVFMDIDAIPFGSDFRRYIGDAMQQARILVEVIGPKWLGPKDDGLFRIMDPTDPVRIEVETAIKLGITVVPVLVDGARMPQPSDLPASLEDFPYFNACEVDSGRDFHTHVGRLKNFLEGFVTEEPVPEVQAAAAQPVAASTVATIPAAAVPEPVAAVLPQPAPVYSAAPVAPAPPQPVSVSANGAAFTVPHELINHWSWGPFFLAVFWVWWNADQLSKILAVVFFVLGFIPYLGFFTSLGFAVYMGINGNRLMVANRSFTSLQHFNEIRTAWARWGIGVFVATFVIAFFIGVAASMSRSGGSYY
jgi:hypothetical protein